MDCSRHLATSSHLYFGDISWIVDISFSLVQIICLVTFQYCRDSRVAGKWSWLRNCFSVSACPAVSSARLCPPVLPNTKSGDTWWKTNWLQIIAGRIKACPVSTPAGLLDKTIDIFHVVCHFLYFKYYQWLDKKMNKWNFWHRNGHRSVHIRYEVSVDDIQHLQNCWRVLSACIIWLWLSDRIGF